MVRRGNGTTEVEECKTEVLDGEKKGVSAVAVKFGVGIPLASLALGFVVFLWRGRRIMITISRRE